MKTILFVALLALTTPTQARIMGLWVSDHLGISVEVIGLDFYVHQNDASAPTQACKIVDWPLSTPIAKGECKNGDKYDLEIYEGGLRVNGFEMTQTFEAPD